MDEPLRKAGQWPNVAIPAGSDPHEVMDSHKDNKEQDTREKLEEDVRSAVHGAYAYEDYIPEDMIIGWLNRQAAITECKFWECYANGNQWEAHQYEIRCAELTAERDKLQEQLQRANKSLSTMGILRLNEQIDKLTAECDRLQKVVRIQAESFRKLEQELKEARDGVRGSHDDDKPGDEKVEG